jgi:hypothetical protein
MTDNLKLLGGSQFADIVKVFSGLIAIILTLFLLITFTLYSFWSEDHFRINDKPVNNLDELVDYMIKNNKKFGKISEMAFFAYTHKKIINIKNENLSIKKILALHTLLYIAGITFFTLFPIVFGIVLFLWGRFLYLYLKPKLLEKFNTYKNLNNSKTFYLYMSCFFGGYYYLSGMGSFFFYFFSVIFLIKFLHQLYFSTNDKVIFKYVFYMNSISVIILLLAIIIIHLSMDNLVAILIKLIDLLVKSIPTEYHDDMIGFAVKDFQDLSPELLGKILKVFINYTLENLVFIGILFISFIQTLQVFVFRYRNYGKKNFLMALIALVLFDIIAFAYLYYIDKLDYSMWIFIINGGLAIIAGDSLNYKEFKINKKYLYLTTIFLAANYFAGIFSSILIEKADIHQVGTLVAQATSLQITQGIDALSESILSKYV